MDRRDFRQIDERYIAGKAIDGASLDNIVDGVYNPVEEMNYLTGTSNTPTKPTTDTATQGASTVFWLVLIAFITILAVVTTFLK